MPTYCWQHVASLSVVECQLVVFLAKLVFTSVSGTGREGPFKLLIPLKVLLCPCNNDGSDVSENKLGEHKMPTRNLCVAKKLECHLEWSYGTLPCCTHQVLQRLLRDARANGNQSPACLWFVFECDRRYAVSFVVDIDQHLHGFEYLNMLQSPLPKSSCQMELLLRILPDARDGS